MASWSKTLAFAVHVLTASGAVCGLLALHHATRQEWSLTFLWLGVALIIDGADGPLARRAGNALHWPRFCGERLDLAVDYFNYCAVPAFIIVQSGLMDAPLALTAGALILMSSLFHFADRNSKTADGFFVGFPAIWNIICLYVFAFDVRGLTAFAVLAAFAGLTFVPFHWLHPLRVARLRPLTLAVTAAWGAAAVAAIANGFPSGTLERAVLAAAGAYVVAVGLSRSFWPPAGRGAD